MRSSLALLVALLAQAPRVIAQAPPAASTSVAGAGTPVAPPAPSTTATPSFVFLSMPTATACQSVNVMWAYNGPNADKMGVDIYAFNVGVPQSIPPPSPSTSLSAPAQQTSSAAPPPAQQTTPAAQPSTTPAQQTPSQAPQPNPAPTTQAARPSTAGTGGGLGAPVAGPPQENTPPGKRMFDYPPMLVGRDVFRRADINATVTKGWQANVLNPWKVNVPPGRYRLFAIVNDTFHTNAISPEAFTVLQGTDSSCIQVASENPIVSPPPSSANPSASSSAKPSNGTAAGAAEGTTSKGISGGAIAGIIIGVLAGLALLGLLAFCCVRRRRNGADRARGGLGDMGPAVNGKQVGEPTAFRHIKRPSSFGHIGTSLGALGRSRERHNALGSDDTNHEKGISNLTPLPYRDASLPQNDHLVVPELQHQPQQQRRGSSYSTATSNDNPFETAPSTPIDEKTSFGAPIGLAAAVAAAGGAGAAAAHKRNSARREPESVASSTSPSSGDGASSAGLISTPSDSRRLSTPTPGGLAPPPTNLTPYGSPNPTSGRSTPPSPPLDTTAPNSPAPPSSFNSQGLGGSPRPPAAERKASLRRKPVPRLAADDEAARSDGHGSGSGHEYAASSDWGHTSAPTEVGRLPELRIGGGPAGDEFGLSAALGLGGARPSSSGSATGDKKTFQLIPDQPLRQD